MQLSVGTAIRTYREAKGWNQDALAKAAKLDKNTVSRIELGGNTNVDTLLRISRALGVDLEVKLLEPAVGTATRVRDVQSSLTPSVSTPDHTRPAPGEEPSSVLPPSFPMSPAHVVLYAFIAKLSADQADRLTRPVLDLIDHVRADDSGEPLPPKKTK